MARSGVTALGGQFPVTFFLGLPCRIAGLRRGREQPKVESGAITTDDLSRGRFVRCGGVSVQNGAVSPGLPTRLAVAIAVFGGVNPLLAHRRREISMDQLTAARIQTVRDHMRLECEHE